MMLLTPSNTPEFSPVENLFGYVKKKLQDEDIQTKEQVTYSVTDFMFSLKEFYFVGFYRKTLNNMKDFWRSLDRQKILDNDRENIPVNVIN